MSLGQYYKRGKEPSISWYQVKKLMTKIEEDSNHLKELLKDFQINKFPSWIEKDKPEFCMYCGWPGSELCWECEKRLGDRIPENATDELLMEEKI